MAELFDCSTDNISLHLRNIFKEQELYKNSATEDFSLVEKEGERQVKRTQTFYNLDAIISVGYRVNSTKATQFRIWATKTLKKYLTQGYVVNKNLTTTKRKICDITTNDRFVKQKFNKPSRKLKTSSRYQ